MRKSASASGTGGRLKLRRISEMGGVAAAPAAQVAAAAAAAAAAVRRQQASARGTKSPQGADADQQRSNSHSSGRVVNKAAPLDDVNEPQQAAINQLKSMGFSEKNAARSLRQVLDQYAHGPITRVNIGAHHIIACLFAGRRRCGQSG